jgi:hypothetical protein
VPAPHAPPFATRTALARQARHWCRGHRKAARRPREARPVRGE